MLKPYFIMMLSESVNNKIKEAKEFPLGNSPSLSARDTEGVNCGLQMLPGTRPRSSIPDQTADDFTHHFYLTCTTRSYLGRPTHKERHDATKDWLPLREGLAISLAGPSAKCECIFWSLFIKRLIAEH